ncbi:LytR/AlgR family response regulator transcription factor [Spirosoma panaciterrae]|uniref:LytR/AlgR family response regulator transcription factor n=1 Tax=Spirosoma panaciterrae TaxID=496058 RepID=UPI0003811392|nr:LytTR family DNA-binding domain-containing protein [Spirosoma panaciterrae]
MKARKYIIIDVVETDIADLKDKLQKFPLLECTRVCHTLEEAVEVLAKESIDLIFLDANLGDDDGLTLLKCGINLPSVIVTSKRPEDALECYNIGTPADFLLKPFTFERLLRAMSRTFRQQFASNSFANLDSIFLKTGRKIQRFNYQAIDYIESYGIYSKVHMSDGYQIVNERVASLAKLLPAHFFMRVHKSFIINISKITSFDRSALSIGTTKIPIGVSYRQKLEGLLNLLEVTDSKYADE